VVDPEAVRRFAELVQRPDEDIPLDRAALLLGTWDRPVDVEAGCARLDALATTAAAALDGFAGRPFAGARAVCAALFTREGFRGNADDYYDPRNSFLADVLDRRLGIPISLSVVFLEVARRIGCVAAGVGFPGHFLVRAFDRDRAVVLDPFEGGAVVGRDALQERLQRTAGSAAKLEPAMLAPVGHAPILTRMLSNLAGIYGQRGDLFRSLEVLERLHALDPANPRLRQELEALRGRVEDLN
jgi:regulator of sirC expression with transglutaminase-like and TPR domain